MSEETEGKNDLTPEEHVEELLDKTEEVGEEIAAAGQELNEQGTLIADQARTFRKVIREVPAIQFGPDYENMVDGLTNNLNNLYVQKSSVYPVYRVLWCLHIPIYGG